MTAITALLTNKAYGYPTRGARRRRKPTILACLHQTSNATATAIGERNYANRAGSWGPSATAYVDRDGTIVRAKLCTVCGVVTSRPGSRCGQHPRLSGIGANHHVHADPRWIRLSKRMIDRHVGQHGYVCPGDGAEHPAHPLRDLTLDHVVALIDGGAPFDPANTRVLCRSRNSANGARLVNARRADRGHPHAGAALLDVRASQSCARGRVSPFLSLRERGGGAGVVGQSGGQRATWASVGARGRSQAGTR